MKSPLKIAPLLITFLSALSLYSQNYGNEWINFNQKYYSFNVYSSGVHKIDFSTLSSSGIPINTFNSQNIQIFGKEREIPLYISDGGDSFINPGDFILFYAEQNDGWQLIRYKGLGLGWIKKLQNRVNNYFPKEWRIRMSMDKLKQ